MLKTVKTQDEMDLTKGKSMILFSATWCGMCSMFKPVVEEFAAKHDDVNVYLVDVDESRELTREFGVNSIPCYFIYENNKPVNSNVGFIALPQLEKLVLG